MPKRRSINSKVLIQDSKEINYQPTTTTKPDAACAETDANTGKRQSPLLVTNWSAGRH
jgi:hypothetical protein